jgi:hypothetical protein
MELGRFYNSKDESIILAQTHNHARLVLNKRKNGLKRMSHKIKKLNKNKETNMFL